MVIALRIVTIPLISIALTVSSGYADHERFTVAEMRNVDLSAEVITSTSGACVPSHDRERLDCYFTSFGLWRTQTDQQLKKQFDDAVQETNKDPAKQIRDLKKVLCDDKKLMEPDPIRLKHNVGARAFYGSVKAFCDRPTRDSALTFFWTMTESDARKCRCMVSDWRSTFVRQIERWVENTGPSGLCGVVKGFTLIPHDLAKMKETAGPILWRLDERSVVTRADNAANSST